MVLTCAAFGCKSRFLKGGGITFHSFPMDAYRRSLWVLNSRRANFEPSKNHRMCSKHFTPDSFDTNKFGGTWLKNNAVPTLFDLPSQLQNIPMVTIPPIANPSPVTVTSRKKNKKQDEQEAIKALATNGEFNEKSQKQNDREAIKALVANGELNVKSAKRYGYLGDFEEEDMYCPERAKRALSIAKNLIAKQKQQLANIRRQNRRFRKKKINSSPRKVCAKISKTFIKDKNSLKMSSNWKSGIKGVLLDITGVLYESGQGAIPGSVEAIERLKFNKIPFRFVTNETQRTCSSLVTKLKNFGFTLSESDVISPGVAVASYLKQNKLRPLLLIHPELLPEFSECDQNSPNCVVVGDAAEHFTYENMNRCFQLLLKSENPILISMGRGKYYKEMGEIVMDLGGYTCALEFAAGVEATVIGKPSPDYFLSAVENLGILPHETVMVGDDINSDIGASQKCGLKGVLVRTGKFREIDLQNSSVAPDVVVENLAHFVDILLSEGDESR